MDRRIGVLVVHGIGEQKESEQRDAVARSLVQAWQKKHGHAKVTQLGEPPVKCREPVRIVIRDAGEVWKIDVREVYWGDADEDPQGSAKRLRHQVHFWRWGLSQWALRRYSTPQRLDGAQYMREPVPKGESSVSLCTRAKLFGVSIAFALLGVTWELLRFLLRRIRVVMAGSSVLARYLGDVALYTDNEYQFRPEVVKLTDAPRDAIRRRMVRGLVDMACEKYDRWYVVAHSLGSVVAYNGLMELAEALPNYLDHADWTRKDLPCGLKKQGEVDVSCWSMKPPRPDWLGNKDTIDRSVLFDRLRGFCTYGSPLDKFAMLWPAIVPINNDPKPLENCKWINVYDRMDPVAGHLDRFGLCGGFVPCNVAYKSSWLFILAHIQYFRTRRCADGFAERLAEWITTDRWSEGCSPRFGGGCRRKCVRYVWWFLLSAFALAPLAWVVSTVCDHYVELARRFVNTLTFAGEGFWCRLAKEASAALFVLIGVVFLVIAMTLWDHVRRRGARPREDE